MITKHTIPCLDLKQIAESGQCFRMNPLDLLPEGTDYGYRIISRGRLLDIWQQGQELTFDCAGEDLDFWLDYFDIATDYQAMINCVAPGNTYLAEAAQAGKGIRILKQDPWEMIITFVISQQKTIPKIRQLVEALCASYGTPVNGALVNGALVNGALVNGAPVNGTPANGIPGKGPEVSIDGPDSSQRLFSFPSPEELSRASLDELKELKLGYRAKYIYQLCQDAVSGALDLAMLDTMDYDAALLYLTGFYGIGKKVANCVCLFGLHHIGAFPVDTWIEKILMAQYYDKRKYRRTPKTCLCDTIVKDVFGQYGGCAGVMQQYIFYYERLRNSKLS